MRALILSLALLAGPAQAALRGGTGPTNPTPDVPPTSWQPPFILFKP